MPFDVSGGLVLVGRWREASAGADRRAQLDQANHARDRPDPVSAARSSVRRLRWRAAQSLRGRAARPADAAKRRSARPGWMRATADRRQAQSAPPQAARLDPIKPNSAVLGSYRCHCWQDSLIEVGAETLVHRISVATCAIRCGLVTVEFVSPIGYLHAS